MATARWGSRLRVAGAGGVAVLLLGLAACSGSSAKPTQPTGTTKPTTSGSSASGPCTLSAKAVPSCGVLWGIATHPPTDAAVVAAETAIGRKVDFVYRYHDVNDTIPDSSERQWVAQGKLLHIDIAARDFSSGSTRGSVTWADVANGDFDKNLTAQAKGIASLKVPVFMTFEQEASQKHKLAALGSPADFVRAWRHLHDIYQNAGVTNAVWTWVMTGAQDNLQSAGQLWPGNAYVDWISWNVYNQSGCKSNRIDQKLLVSFKDKMLIFYNWLKTSGPHYGIDTTKPIMISETGSAMYAQDLQATADWYAAIPSVLQQYPQIKAIGLWDSTDAYCNYDFTGVPAIASGVRQASASPFLSLHGALSPAG
jgi:hypothetical protein